MSNQAIFFFFSFFMSLSIILLLFSLIFSVSYEEYNFANYEFLNKLKSNCCVSLNNEKYTIDMSKWHVLKPKFNKMIGNGIESLITLVYSANNTNELNSLQLFDPIEKTEFYNVYIKIATKDSNQSLVLNNDGIFSYLSHCYLYNIHIYLPDNVIIKSYHSGASILSNEIDNCEMFHIGIYFNNLTINTDNYNQKLGLISQRVVLSEDDNILVGLFVKGNILNYNISNYPFYSGILIGEIESSSMTNNYLCLSYSFVDINVINIYSNLLSMKKIENHFGGMIGYITTKVDIINDKKHQHNNNKNKNDDNNNENKGIKMIIKNCYMLIRNGISIFKHSENDYCSINIGGYIGKIYKSERETSNSLLFYSKTRNNQKIIVEISESWSYISINDVSNSGGDNNVININGLIGSISNEDNNIITIMKDSYIVMNLLSMKYNQSIDIDNLRISMEIPNKEISMKITNSYSLLIYPIIENETEREFLLLNEERLSTLYCYYKMNKCDYRLKNEAIHINNLKIINNYELTEKKENNVIYYYYKHMPYYLDNRIMNFNKTYLNSDIYFNDKNNSYNYISTSIFYMMIITPFHSIYDKNRIYKVIIIPKSEEIRRIYLMKSNREYKYKNNITIIPSNPCIRIKYKRITHFSLNLSDCSCKMKKYTINIRIRINEMINENKTLSFYCNYLNNSNIKYDIDNSKFNSSIEDNNGINSSDDQDPYKFIMMIICFLLIIACGCNMANRGRSKVIRGYRIINNDIFGNAKENSDVDV